MIFELPRLIFSLVGRRIELRKDRLFALLIKRVPEALTLIIRFSAFVNSLLTNPLFSTISLLVSNLMFFITMKMKEIEKKKEQKRESEVVYLSRPLFFVLDSGKGRLPFITKASTATHASRSSLSRYKSYFLFCPLGFLLFPCRFRSKVIANLASRDVE